MTQRTSKYLKLVVTLAVVGGAGFFVYRRTARVEPVKFTTVTVDRGVIEQTVTATGQLNAVITVQVGSQVSGMIQKLHADFNSKVEAGQVVAQLEPTRFKANLEQARASLKNAEASATRARVNVDTTRREYERAKTLDDRKIISQSELDLLRSRHELANAELQATEAQIAQARASVGVAVVDLERTTIRSPISGIVLQRAVDVGQTVAASLSAPILFTIAQDLSKMEVRTAIDEADVGRLQEGLEARFTVDAHPGREFVATIHQIRSNPNVLQNVVTYDAILRVDNPDGKLRPGMTANVRIVTERREDALRIPNAALRFRPPAALVLAAPAPGPGEGGGGFGRGDRGDADGGAGDRAGGGPEGERRRWSREGGGGPGGRGGGGPGGGRGNRGGGEMRRLTVYKVQGGKLLPLRVRPGVSDEQFTEVVRGQLKAGDEVVVEATGPGIDDSAAPRPGMQGGGQRRPGGPGGPGMRMF